MARRRHAPQREAIDLQTPFHKLPGDLLLTTARKLGEFGLHAELADAIRRPESEAIVRQHLHNLSEALWPQRAVCRREATEGGYFIHGMFTPPEQQIANVREWKAEYVKEWGDVPIDEWLANLGPAPTWPDGRLQCVVLELALPDQSETKDAGGHVIIEGIPGYIRTVRDLWRIISAQHPNNGKKKELFVDAEHLFLLDGATYEPGLRWRVHDLGANLNKRKGVKPIDVRNSLTSPDVDGFAALAHHPRYVRRMGGAKNPRLWIAGFQVTIPGYLPRRAALLTEFGHYDQRVILGTEWVDYQDPNCSIPCRLGCNAW